MDLRKNLVQATKKVKTKASSTFTAVVFDPEEHSLKGINLGDSGFMIIRKVANEYTPHFRTPIIQYKFNHPA